LFDFAIVLGITNNQANSTARVSTSFVENSFIG